MHWITFDSRIGRATRWGWLLALAGLLQCGRAADTTPRLRLELAPNSPWPAAVSTFETWPSLPASARVAVSTADGKPVAAQVLWSAQGEPARVQFDSSGGATRYVVRFDDKASTPSTPWRPQAGVLLETRACRAGPVNTMTEVTRLLGGAGPTYGRGFVPEIFLGLNPFGPSTDYVALFTGWFTAPKAGEYKFATTSAGASYLRVDGRLVADWLGQHGPHGGRRGEHSGRLQLRPGVHQLEYVQVQFAGESAAVAAWQPPGDDRLQVMPASAFLPVGRFRAASFEPGASPAEQLYFEWTTTDHCRLGESAAIRMRFTVVNPPGRRTYKWRFDDGTEDAGQVSLHVFALAGLREVALEAWENQQRVAAATARVRVAPAWAQREDWRGDIFAEAKKEFLRRDLTRMPRLDLLAVLGLADRADDPTLLRQVGAGLLQRAAEFNPPASAATFFRLTLAFERQGDPGDALAEKACRLALSPERTQPVLEDHVKLRLAALLIDTGGDLDEAQKLLGNAPANSLRAEEKRLWRRLQGDLALARGQVENAQKLYAGAGSGLRRTRFDAVRAARLESASLALEQGNLDEAQQALEQLYAERPDERLSLDAGLVRVRLDLQRKCNRRAAAGATILCRLAGRDPRKSEALYALAEADFALGRPAEGNRIVGELLKAFPYSESAAKAKDQWRQSR
jgi:predicted negative regulator of RcsB-dependent stress response